METVKNRREEYAETTRAALLDSGRRLFIERGFAQTSAEEIARAARLTRGALYHHFDGKRGLFEAVFEEVEQTLADRLIGAMAHETDPWSKTLSGLDTFLDECAREPYSRIVLREGPIALGWDRWRELDERHMMSVVHTALGSLMDAGVIEPYPVALVARATYGLLTELAWGISTAPDQAEARRVAGPLAHRMIGSLRRS